MKTKMRSKTLVSALIVLFVVSIIPVLAEDEGEGEEVDLTVTVVGGLPVADAGGPYFVYRGRTLTFDGSGSSDADGTIEKYEWDFDDGGIGTGPTPSHIYSSVGTYTVTLTVTDNDDFTASDTAVVTVRKYTPPTVNERPVADAGPDQAAYVAETVDFSGAGSYDPDGTIVSYEWDFGDETTTSGVAVEHEYLEPGDYTVTLTVKDNRNGKDSDTCTITVMEHVIPVPPLPPILDNLVIMPDEVELGEEVTISLDIENIDSQSIDYIVTMKIGELTLLVDVELEAYESMTVSRTITPGAVGEYSVTVDGLTGSFTVEAPEIPPTPAEFEVMDLTITPEEVEPGDEVTISVLVTNIGEETGDYTITLDLPAGPYLREKTVSLEGGESERVEFEVSRDIEGTYAVEVDGLTGSFTVKSQEIPPTPAEFVVSDLEAEPDEVEAGEEITMMVEVENIGEEMGTHTIQFNVDGSFTDLPEITLDGGESTTVTFTIIIEVAGEHTVSVEDLTEVITVTAPPSGISVAYYAGVTIIIVVAGVIIYLTWKGKFPTIYTKPE